MYGNCFTICCLHKRQVNTSWLLHIKYTQNTSEQGPSNVRTRPDHHLTKNNLQVQQHVERMRQMVAVAYLGGPRCDGPPFDPTMKIFYRWHYMKKCIFLLFSSKFQNKWVNLRLLLNVQKQKVFQLQGGFAPLTRGSAPGPCWGIHPHTPVIGSCSAHSP